MQFAARAATFERRLQRDRVNTGAVTNASDGRQAAFPILLRCKEKVFCDVRTNHMTTKQFKRGNRWRQRRHQAGMTLVEVTVAMAIAGLAIGGIINGYNYCTTSSQKAALFLAANARAMERIEETRSAKWDTASSPVVDAVTSANFTNKLISLDISGTGGVILPATVQTTITPVSVNPPLKRIRVDCIWQYRGVQWVTNTIETYRAPDQ
jgi:prepilin-type N-terminal cleavage/methylation domain-containing protein